MWDKWMGDESINQHKKIFFKSERNWNKSEINWNSTCDSFTPSGGRKTIHSSRVVCTCIVDVVSGTILSVLIVVVLVVVVVVDVVVFGFFTILTEKMFNE